MAIVPAPSYAVDLPDSEDISHMLDDAIEYWQYRDKFIRAAREMIAGENVIVLPKTRGYKAVARHTYKLLSWHQQKLARFGHMPSIAVIPYGRQTGQQTRAEKIEQFIRESLYEIERRGNSFWKAAAGDALLLDEGVVRVVRAPADFWPDLAPYQGEDDEAAKSELYRVYESSKDGGGAEDDEWIAMKEDYKKEAGIPFDAPYVPLENWYPYFENSLPIFSFEVDHRSLQSVLSNPNFDQEALDELRRSAQSSDNRDISFNTEVTIVRYANQKVLATYVMTATGKNRSLFFPDPTEARSDVTPGKPMLLHVMNHDLGVLPYARVPGAFGGWTSQRNGIERVTGALIELNQVLDEMASQGFTNVRVRYWPTTVMKLNPQYRGQDRGRPRAPDIEEGGTIPLYEGEDLALLFQAENDPMFQFLWNKVESDMSFLGATPALFGIQEGGEVSGYQENLRITQSESLDEMRADGLAQGAVNIGTLLLRHARVMDEKLYASHVVVEKHNGKQRKLAQIVELEPTWLSPMPKLDAQVSKPRPIDWLAMIRAAIDLTVPQGGNPPLATQQFARERLLNIEDPIAEERGVRIEMMQNIAVQQGVLTQMVMQSLRLMSVEETAGQGDPEQLAQNADPALLQGIQELNQTEAATPGQGGVNPGILNAVDQQFTTRNGGPVQGAPQPEQDVGRALARGQPRIP